MRSFYALYAPPYGPYSLKLIGRPMLKPRKPKNGIDYLYLFIIILMNVIYSSVAVLYSARAQIYTFRVTATLTASLTRTSTRTETAPRPPRSSPTTTSPLPIMKFSHWNIRNCYPRLQDVSRFMPWVILRSSRYSLKCFINLLRISVTARSNVNFVNFKRFVFVNVFL